MASVRKRKWNSDGIDREAWVVAYTDRGGKRRLKTFEKKKDADRYRQQVESEIESGIHVAERETTTVNEAADAFSLDCERRNKIGDRMSGSSLVQYQCNIRRVKERFGARKLTSLTAQDAQDWLDELSLKYKRAAIQARYACLLAIVKLAVRRKWLRRNVLLDEPPRIGVRREKRKAIPTKEEIFALIRAMNDPGSVPQWGRNFLSRRAFLTLGLFSGMRRGEIAGLQWENVDFENEVIRIRHSLSVFDGLKEPKTHAGVRDIPMSPLVRHALEELRDYWMLRERIWRERPPGGYVYNTLWGRLDAALKSGVQPDESGPPLTGYVLRLGGKKDFAGGQPIGCVNLAHHHWRKIMKAAGLLDAKGKPRFTPHALRHAAVSLMIESGLPAEVVKEVIGHSSVKTTLDIYTHLFPNDGRAAAAIKSIGTTFAPQPRLPAPA